MTATTTITATLIQAQGREMQGLALSPERSAELAAEVGRIQERMAAAIPEFWFFDEPAQFLGILEELREVEP
ncbi:MAG: hypothetical protein AB7P02_29145 [Alphaproteobacteria bacterium]